MSHWEWETYMATQRTHIVLPAELIKEIDALVGPRGRSAFIAETVRAELRKRRLLAFFSREEPAWKDEDHPELANGTEAWLHELRRPSRENMEKILSNAFEEEKQPG